MSGPRWCVGLGIECAAGCGFCFKSKGTSFCVSHFSVIPAALWRRHEWNREMSSEAAVALPWQSDALGLRWWKDLSPDNRLSVKTEGHLQKWTPSFKVTFTKAWKTRGKMCLGGGINNSFLYVWLPVPKGQKYFASAWETIYVMSRF